MRTGFTIHGCQDECRIFVALYLFYAVPLTPIIVHNAKYMSSVNF